MKCKWRNVYLGVVLALLLPVSGWAASWEQARPEEVKAFKSGNLQEVKRIVERFGRTFEDPYTLATALDFAASSANVDLMKYLKSKGWLERCHQQAYPCFPLHAAADEGAGTDMLEFLIAEGFQVDGRGPLLMSPIIMAAQNGRFEAVRYLCEAGADPKATNDEGTNVLQLARTRLGAVRLHYDPKEDAKIRANIKKVIQYLESGQCKKK